MRRHYMYGITTKVLGATYLQYQRYELLLKQITGQINRISPELMTIIKDQVMELSLNSDYILA